MSQNNTTFNTVAEFLANNSTSAEYDKYYKFSDELDSWVSVVITYIDSLVR